MRLALVLHGAGVGGTERHVESLLGFLPDLGVEVELITSEEGALADRAGRLGLPVRVIPRSRRLSYVFLLLQHLTRGRFDVVHSHSGRLPCLAARLAGVPRIIDTRHGLLDPRIGGYRSGRAYWIWEGRKSRLAHVTVVVCRADRDRLVREGGLPPDRVELVYNGVAVGEPGGKREERRRWNLGFVGRLSREKASERAVECFARMLERDDLPPGAAEQARLVVVGGGPELGNLERRAEELGVRSRLLLAGPVPDARRWIRGLGALLLPSRAEGVPYVLLEALAEGTPVLATPVGGIPEVLDGDLAASVLPWDPGEWSGAVARLLRDDIAWQTRSQAGIRRVKSFTEEKTVRDLRAVYEGGRPSRLGVGEEEGV